MLTDLPQARRPFKVYRSSAGSGKTFTLTKEYLKLALYAPLSPKGNNGRYFRHILAVTFTNDAANEMKQRIMKELKKFAELPLSESDDMLTAILQEIHSEHGVALSDEEIRQKAQTVYRELLHNYSDFSVSTIDKFNKRVVDAFKKDLGLPFDYDLLLDYEELVSKAVDQLYLDVGEEHQQELTSILIAFTEQAIEEEQDWQLDKSIKSEGKVLFEEATMQHMERIRTMPFAAFEQAIREAKGNIKKIEKAIAEPASRAVNLFEGAGLTVKSFSYTKNGIGSYFVNHAKDPGSILLAHKLPNSHQRKAIEEDNWFAQSNSHLATKLEPIKAELIACFEQIELVKSERAKDWHLCKAIEKKGYPMALLLELERQIDKLKREGSLVHISEFNQKINQVVEREPIPYLFERLGERYHHILIDEFQDTSEMQWHNLLPLLINSLSKEQDSLIVGDAKQSIYRWRSGNATMLVDLPKLNTLNAESPLKLEQPQIERSFSAYQLGTNWRSGGEIVAFNNRLYKFLTESLPLEQVQGFYGQAEQQPNKGAWGSVSIDFIYKEGKKKPEAAVLARTLETLEILMENGVQMGEVAILVRTNNEGSTIATFLMEHGIDVVSGESLLLKNSVYIRFLINFFKAFMDPENATYKMEVLRFLLHIRAETLEQNKMGEVIAEFAEKVKSSDPDSFFEAVAELVNVDISRRRFSFQSLYEMSEELIRVFGLNENATEQPYLQHFLDMVQARTGKQGGNLNDFLEHWEAKKEKLAISTPNTGNAVRIMTVHKAKGLEFPAVIMPFASYSIKNNDEAWLPTNGLGGALPVVPISMKKDLGNVNGFENHYQDAREYNLLDNLNLLYVATTRPKVSLHIICDISNNVKPPMECSNMGEMLHSYCKNTAGEGEDFEVTVPSGESTTAKTYRFGKGVAESFMASKERKARNSEGKSKVQQFDLGVPIHAPNREQIDFSKEGAPTAAEALSLEAVTTAKEKGVLIHYAFEKVVAYGDIPQAVQELLLEGWINQEDVPDMVRSMEAVAKLPAIAQYFDHEKLAEVMNEREILIKKRAGKGRILRPDRLVRLKEGSWAIIDYKTGKEQIGQHRKQVRQYAKALQEMGHPAPKCFLVYTEEPTAVEV